MINYPITDYSLPFSEYINRTRAIIAARRMDLRTTSASAQRIINTNCPYELFPSSPIRHGKRLKYGALLIHGLLDCPFSLRDTANYLQQQGVLCRSILLPGHGTRAQDLLHVRDQEWIQAVRYGIKKMEPEVEKLFLIGYSTGAALSILHAQENSHIAGIILLAPAIKIKAPVDIVVSWHHLVKWLTNHKQWIYREDEVDYAKYLSICFNAVTQVSAITKTISEINPPACPQLFITSKDDETISCNAALEFFAKTSNPKNKFLLYTTSEKAHDDKRIISRNSKYDHLHIQSYAHVAIPFAPSNPHYGQRGDYPYASTLHAKDVIFGAYNRIESNSFETMYKLGLVKKRRRELTYNPDFEFMVKEIRDFIFG